MTVEGCLQQFNPFSSGFQVAVDKFAELDLHKKVAVVAETAIAGVKSFFLFGAGAVPAFRSLVNKWNVKESEKGAVPDQLSSSFVLDSKNLSDEELKSKAKDTKEELASRIGTLAKRWAFKLIPKVVPEMKVPFKVIKIAKKVLGLGQSAYKKDLIGVVRKLIPIAFGIIGTLIGGPIFGAVFLAFKVYSWASLFFDTAREVKNVYCYWKDPASEPTKAEKLFDSTILAAAS